MFVFYFLVMLMPLDQHPLWGKMIDGGTVVKWIGLVCLLYAVGHLATTATRHYYLKTLQARIFLLFSILMSVSYWFVSSGPFSMRSVFMIYVSMALLFFLVLSVVDTLNRLRWTLLTAVGSMGLTSVYVFREWMRDPMWRPGSVAGDANYFALDATLVLPLGVLLLLRSKTLWERVFALGCVIATIVSTTLGASRGGLLALVAAFLWLVWHSPRRTRNFIVIAVLFVPPLLLLPSSPVRRLFHPRASDNNGKVARLIAWKAGLRMIEHHPLTGVGAGEFKPKMPEYVDPGVGFTSIAHNTYVEIAAETGLPTFFVFLCLLFWAYRGYSRVRKQVAESGPALVHLAASGLQAGLFGSFVGLFFLSAEDQKLFWLCVFLSMCLPPLASMLPSATEGASRYALPGRRLVPAAATSTGVNHSARREEQPVSAR